MPMQSDELRDALRNFDMVLPSLGDAFGSEVFTDVSAPRCKLLANFGVGYNHIDVEAAAKANVLVSNTPGAVTDATADVAMTLILMSARRAGEGERLVRAGQWKGWHPTQMLGLHVTGKTVGIAGLGRIGQAIAQRCHYGFGMAVKYWNRSEKELPYAAERIEDLTALAAQVDILVAAVPGGAETQHLFNAEVFGAMQSHAHFINISRGEVVKESALIATLQNNEIGGAGLDVYEFEPRVPDSLRKLDNVTLLPHLGTAALEIRTQMGLMAVDNLLAYEQGETPPNLV
mmetsp:Transcript_12801/g.20397  ORF Transcript_12801/g.20397 Transcript_12801/m.20397 type:complete len:288 (+) Transcript_12801:489-1352(+)